jgi:hypothetical protein
MALLRRLQVMGGDTGAGADRFAGKRHDDAVGSGSRRFAGQIIRNGGPDFSDRVTQSRLVLNPGREGRLEDRI